MKKIGLFFLLLGFVFLTGCDAPIEDFESYSIIYEDYDGTTLKTETFEFTEEVSQLTPPNPTRQGYTFVGWDSPLPSTMPENDVIIQAKYEINQYTLEFVDYDESIIYSETFDYGADLTTVTYPDEPVRDGFTFKEWDSNIPSMMPEGGISITPVYLVNYDIIYETDNGINTNTLMSYNVETPTYTLTEPVKEGYTFQGWYDNSAFSGNPITEILVGSTGDITLYANWMIDEYYITYAIVSEEYDPLTHYILSPDDTIVKIFSGHTTGALITAQNNVFVWGYNEEGQLGDGTLVSSSTPIDITSGFNLLDDETIEMIGMGYSHSALLTSEGRIFTWGDNEFGQIGIRNSETQLTPRDITTMFSLDSDEKIIKLSVAGNHSAVLTSKGQLFTWGYNWSGELGNGTTNHSYSPINVTDYLNLNDDETIIDVQANGFNTAVLTSANRLFIWGFNGRGQLTDDSGLWFSTLPVDITDNLNLNENETINQISIGFNHAVGVITSENRLLIWGNNQYGQIGNGTSNDTDINPIPIDITNQFNLQADEVFIDLSLGSNHSSVLTSNNQMFTWGLNGSGELGNGTTIDSLTPINITSEFSLDPESTIQNIALGSSHSFALTSDGSLYSWGQNADGQIGREGTSILNWSPYELLFSSPEIDSREVYGYNANIDNLLVLDETSFDGWYLDMALTIPFTLTQMPAEDIILYGKWITE